MWFEKESYCVASWDLEKLLAAATDVDVSRFHEESFVTFISKHKVVAP